MKNVFKFVAVISSLHKECIWCVTASQQPSVTAHSGWRAAAIGVLMPSLPLHLQSIQKKNRQKDWASKRKGKHSKIDRDVEDKWTASGWSLCCDNLWAAVWIVFYTTQTILFVGSATRLVRCAADAWRWDVDREKKEKRMRSRPLGFGDKVPDRKGPNHYNMSHCSQYN